MTPIIYNLNTVALPLSGTGRYAVELIKAVAVIRKNVLGVKGGQAHTGDDLNRVLNDMERLGTGSLGPASLTPNQGSSWLRRAMSNTPYSRQAYDALNRRALVKASQPWLLEGGKCHDLNYSLDPKAGHICTVYDLSNVVCASTHPKPRVRHLDAYFSQLTQTASPIISISHAVKNELIEYYGVEESRIHVTHLAASEVYHPRSLESCEHTLDSYSLTYKRYLLCVATLEPRKNLPRVLDAYASLDPAIQSEFPLVMVGATGWKSSTLTRRINRLHEAGHIKQLGFVAQHDLPILYAGAAAFIYPSLYEGFGLPLLEAMQSGCACITSDAGALAEVSAAHAVQIDPHRSEEIASAMTCVLSDAESNARYRELGVQRAANFSWAKTARATCQIYDKL